MTVHEDLIFSLRDFIKILKIEHFEILIKNCTIGGSNLSHCPYVPYQN